MIVWIASYPRSGNTFFRIVMNQAFGLKSHSAYDDPQNARTVLLEEVGHAALPSSVDDLRRAQETYFVKTHSLPEDDSPAVYVVRDGRDALVSHAWYLESKRKKPLLRLGSPRKHYLETLRKLIAERPQFGGWSKNVQDWMQRPGRTAVVEFAKLVKNPIEEVRTAFAKLGVPLPPPVTDRIPEFSELQAQRPEFFRKGKTGGWQEEMPPDLQELFMKHHGQTMKAMGYV